VTSVNEQQTHWTLTENPIRSPSTNTN